MSSMRIINDVRGPCQEEIFEAPSACPSFSSSIGPGASPPDSPGPPPPPAASPSCAVAPGPGGLPSRPGPFGSPVSRGSLSRAVRADSSAPVKLGGASGGPAVLLSPPQALPGPLPCGPSPGPGPGPVESCGPPAEGGRGGDLGGPGRSKLTRFPPAPGGEGGGFSSGPGAVSSVSSSYYLDCIAILPSRGESEKAVVFPVPGVRLWRRDKKGDILPEKVGDLAREWEADYRRRTAKTKGKREEGYREAGLELDEAEIDYQLALSDKKNRLNVCGSRVIPGACEEGHGHGKSLICNRPDCLVCRDRAHARRKARWYPKAFKIRDMGVLVVAPPHGDSLLRTAAEISKFRWIVVKVLERWGFDRGLHSFHPFGDPPADGGFPVYHPHFNFPVDAGYLNPEFFEAMKTELRDELGFDMVDIYYQYFQSVKAKCHQVKYLTGPRFLDRAWAPSLYEELYDFSYSGSWGAWGDPGFSHVYPEVPPGVPARTEKAETLLFARWARADVRAESMRAAGRFDDKWSLSEKEEGERTYSEKILAGVCPVCDKKIRWARPVSRFDLGDPVKCPGRWEEILPGGIWQRAGPSELARNFAFIHPVSLREARASPETGGGAACA